MFLKKKRNDFNSLKKIYLYEIQSDLSSECKYKDFLKNKNCENISHEKLYNIVFRNERERNYSEIEFWDKWLKDCSISNSRSEKNIVLNLQKFNGVIQELISTNLFFSNEQNNGNIIYFEFFIKKKNFNFKIDYLFEKMEPIKFEDTFQYNILVKAFDLNKKILNNYKFNLRNVAYSFLIEERKFPLDKLKNYQLIQSELKIIISFLMNKLKYEEKNIIREIIKFKNQQMRTIFFLGIKNWLLFDKEIPKSIFKTNNLIQKKFIKDIPLKKKILIYQKVFTIETRKIISFFFCTKHRNFIIGIYHAKFSLNYFKKISFDKIEKFIPFARFLLDKKMYYSLGNLIHINFKNILVIIDEFLVQKIKNN